MIAEAALAAAGPGAHLVSRPTGVAHVYVGPLTPCGFVPRRRRTVCRARTRRLAPITERRSSLDPEATELRPFCARCSACLSSPGRQAETPCTHRNEYAARYGDLTARDLWAQVVMAETLAELEAVAHISLVVLGQRGCDDLLSTGLTGLRRPVSLTDLIGATRERLAGYPNAHRDETLNALVESAYAYRKAERHAIWQEREERIRQLGIVRATAR